MLRHLVDGGQQRHGDRDDRDEHAAGDQRRVPDPLPRFKRAADEDRDRHRDGGFELTPDVGHYLIVEAVDLEGALTVAKNRFRVEPGPRWRVLETAELFPTIYKQDAGAWFTPNRWGFAPLGEGRYAVVHPLDGPSATFA